MINLHSLQMPVLHPRFMHHAFHATLMAYAVLDGRIYDYDEKNKRVGTLVRQDWKDHECMLIIGCQIQHKGFPKSVHIL